MAGACRFTPPRAAVSTKDCPPPACHAGCQRAPCPHLGLGPDKLRMPTPVHSHPFPLRPQNPSKVELDRERSSF